MRGHPGAAILPSLSEGLVTTLFKHMAILCFRTVVSIGQYLNQSIPAGAPSSDKDPHKDPGSCRLQNYTLSSTRELVLAVTKPSVKPYAQH